MMNKETITLLLKHHAAWKAESAFVPYSSFIIPHSSFLFIPHPSNFV